MEQDFDRAMTPFSWGNPYAWPRKPLLAQNVVATSQPLAAQAGLQMLADGGNAVDAILATAITLSLVEPVSNGIGSDAYALVWDGRKLHGLNASGRSPAAWTADYFRGKAAMPARGWETITVPGCEAAAKKQGGALRASDMAAHRPDWVKPLEMDYRGYTLHEIPPNGQGIVALIALGILDNFDLRSHPVDGADSLHLQIEAVKLAFA